jgi:hypothetical protein
MEAVPGKKTSCFCIEQIKKTDATPHFQFRLAHSSDVENAVWLLKGNAEASIQ